MSSDKSLILTVFRALLRTSKKLEICSKVSLSTLSQVPFLSPSILSTLNSLPSERYLSQVFKHLISADMQ